MLKKITSIIPHVATLTFVVLLSITTVNGAVAASTETITLFGPESFVKPLGEPVTLTKSVFVPTDAKNIIIWAKTGENGKTQGKNATIQVNNETILTSADFRKSNPVTKPTYLQPGENSIEVSLKGNEGNYIMLYITAEVAKSTLPELPQRPQLPFRK